MKRHIAVCTLVVAVAAVFVVGSAGTSEAGLFRCCGWLHGLFHHHHRAPACDPCGPSGYPGAVSTFYGPSHYGRSAYYAPQRSYVSYGTSFYGSYPPAYYGPAEYPATVGTAYSGYDPCCPTVSVASPCDPCGSVCGPSYGYGSASGCPGGVCPPGAPAAIPRAGTPTPGPMPNDPPPYDESPAPSGAPRTFEDEPVPPPTDEFRERTPEAAPVNEPIDETPVPGRTEAFRPTAPDVSSPAIPMPEIEEPIPARPMTPADAPANGRDAEDADDAPDSGDTDAVPAGAPAPARPTRMDERNVAWRAVPAATRSVLTVTYSQPEAVRAPARVNDGWTPKPRGPEFVRN
ncbi:MAG: hypothetical protein WD066_08955 [Planctomycetaceae bacterium]